MSATSHQRFLGRTPKTAGRVVLWNASCLCASVLPVTGWAQYTMTVTNLTNETPPVRYMSLGANTVSSLPLTDTRYNDYYGRTFRLVAEWTVW